MRKIKDLYDSLNGIGKRFMIMSNSEIIEKMDPMHRHDKTLDDKAETLLNKLSAIESDYFFITNHMEVLDELLKDYEFWNEEGTIASEVYKVSGNIYMFRSEKNEFCKRNVRDLIKELDKLYDKNSKIFGNRAFNIAECLNILETFLNVHPELSETIYNLKDLDTAHKNSFNTYASVKQLKKMK